MTIRNTRPIGVFDSGVGGLTVLKALQETLPNENFVYLGDTARLPYGTKSAETIVQYTIGAADLLLGYDIKLLVIACNTASVALPDLKKHLLSVPALGVINPGAEAAAEETKNGHIAVLATEGTVRSGSYPLAIKYIRPEAKVEMLACSLLVALAEEGWCEGQEAEAIVGRYLKALSNGYDTLLLGCTHFPILVKTLKKLVKPSVKIIDSALVTAKSVKTFLRINNLLSHQTAPGKSEFIVTDSPERFRSLAKQFLRDDIDRDIIFAYLSPISQGLVPTPRQAAKAS